MNCPTHEQLHRLLESHAEDSTAREMRTHIDQCSLCKNLLSKIRDELDVARWQRVMQSEGSSLEAKDESRLRRVLEELKSNPPDVTLSDEPFATQRFPGVATPDAALGTLHDYDVVEEIGRGTYGTVYRAFDRRLRRDVAIKVLNPGHAANPTACKRFALEARALSRVRHDHIVSIFDAQDPSPEFSQPYLVIEWIDGSSLADHVANQLHHQKEIFSFPETARLVRQVALALAAAHECGLVHRDIKTSNILLESRTNRAKVTDFGLARELTADQADASRSGRMIGTLQYMSPEQILDPDNVSFECDLYGLGVVLFELLTGERPFRGTSAALLVQIAHDDPPAPCKLAPGIPRDLETICLKCLEKEPSRRYESASDVANELERFLAGEPIQARPISIWERVGKWTKRQPNVAALLVTVALVTALGFVGIAWQWNLAEQGRQAANTAQGVAELARDAERETRKHLEQNLYFSRISLAHHAWLTSNPSRADQLLHECEESRRGWEWRYLKDLFHQELLTLRGAGATIRRIAYSPDGALLASANGEWNSGDPAAVKVWDATSGKLIHTFRSAGGTFHDVDFSRDGKRLATANSHEGITVWNLERDSPELKVTRTGQLDVAFHPSENIVAGAGDDGFVRIWDAATGDLKQELMGHRGNLFDVAFHPGGDWVAAAGHDGKVRVWDWRSGDSIRVFERAGGRCVEFSPDGRHMAASGYQGGYAGIVKIWDIHDDWKAIVSRNVPTGPVLCVTFSPDGQTLALANAQDGVVRILESKTGVQLQMLRPHANAYGLAFSPDGRRLSTSGSDQLVKMWDITRPNPVFKSPRPYICSLAFRPNAPEMALAGSTNLGSPRVGKKTVQIWNVLNARRARLARELMGHSNWPSCVKYSANGKYIASADLDGVVMIWDADTGKVLQKIVAHKGPVRDISFNADGMELASAGGNEKVKLWVGDNGRTSSIFRRTRDTSQSGRVLFSPKPPRYGRRSIDQNLG